MKHLKCESVEVKRVKPQKTLQHNRMYKKIRRFRHWTSKRNLKTIKDNELQEIWRFYVERKVKRFRRPDYKLFLKLIARRTSESKIIILPELSDVFRAEVKRFLHLLEQINNDFKKQARLHFINCIPFTRQDEHSNTVECQTLTLANNFGWKQDRVQFYHDLESRMEFDRRYELQYLELNDEKVEPASTLEDKIRKLDARTINELKDMYRIELIDILEDLPKNFGQKDANFSLVVDSKKFRKYLKKRSTTSIFGLVASRIERHYSFLQKKSQLQLLKAHERLLKLQHVFKEYLDENKIQSDPYTSLFELVDKIEKHYSFLQDKAENGLCECHEQFLDTQRKKASFLREQAQLNLQEKHENSFNDFFRGIIRDGETVRRVSSRQLQSRNIIKDILRNEIAVSDASELMFLSQDRKEIKKVKCELDTNSKISTLLRKLLRMPVKHEFKTSSKVIILSQNVDHVKRIIDNAIEFGEVQKEIKSDNLIKPSKSEGKSFKAFNWKQLLKLTPLLSVVLIPVLMLFNVSLGNLYFPREFKFNYPLLQVLTFAFGLLIYTRGLVLSRLHKRFLSSSSFLLFTAVFITREIAGVSISLCVTPLILIPSYLLFRNLPKIERVRHARQGKFKEALYSLDIKYHEKKFSLLGGSLLFFAIISWCCFIYAPHWFFIPVFLMIAIIMLFTHKSPTATKRFIGLLQKLGLRSHSLASRTRRKYSQYRSENVYRSGILVLIFLVCMPLIFAVNSLVGIMRPDIEYASIPQSDRLDSVPINYLGLEYHSELDEIGELSFNSKFITRSSISPSLFETAHMRVRLIPKNVTPVEGHSIKRYYDVFSDFVSGPKNDYSLITEVPLDPLDLLPGTYEVQNYYSVLSGFYYRTSQPKVCEIEIDKDHLEILSNEPFDLGVDYDAVYTFEMNNSWIVHFNGQVVDSLHRPVQASNISLFIEVNDRYEKIKTLNTNKEGKFYYNHTVYGSIEQNMLAKIEYEGDDLYHPLSHEEYAGLEIDIYGQRFFIDEDRDGYPDWPFDLYDLINVLSSYSESEPSNTLAFIAQFNENSGTITTDLINDLEGILEGNVSWTIGRHDSALEFDGDGEITGGGGIPVIESWNVDGSTSASITLTCDKPTGVQVGDLLVLIAMQDDTSSQAFDATGSSDFTFLGNGGSTTADAHVGIYYKIADGTEGSSESITALSSDEWMMWYVRISGVDTTTPINAYSFSSARSPGTGNPHVIPGVTTDVDDCLVIYALAFDGGDGYTFSASGTGWSEVDEYQTGTSGSGDVSGCFGSRDLASQGASGTASVTCSSNDGAGYCQFAIAPNVPTYEDFDHVDFGDVLDDPLGTSDDEFVISAWIKPTAFHSNQSDNGIKNLFISKAGNLELGINESGFLQVYIKASGADATGTYGFPGAIPLNTWSYLAVRYNSSDVDVLIGDTWCTTAIGGTAEPWNGGGNLVEGGDFIVGAEVSSYSCFTGTIDDVSVFNVSVSNAEIESHSGGPILAIDTRVSKEVGQGGWIPITTSGEVLNGYINFECNSTGKPISSLEFYLSASEPDLQDPNPDDWNLLSTHDYDDEYYPDTWESWDLPNNESWYFVCKATDDINNVVYDYYNVYFGIDHFDDLINFTQSEIDGRVNHNSYLGVIAREDLEWHVNYLDVYINYSGDIDFLTNVTHDDLYSNHWLIYLDSLSDWVSQEGLNPGEYDINFIIDANLTYGPGFPHYSHNHTLNSTILDIKGPDLTLLSGGSYSLVLESTYDNVEDNLITMGINSTDSHFNRVDLDFKYTTPTTSEWISYGTFMANDSLAEIVFDIINLRDDNISFRFTGYDDLLNSKTLYASNYWFVKDFNNHLEFIVEGLSNSVLYGLDQDNMVNLDLKVLPVDNDITKVTISTNYETFTLITVYNEQDHIYFEDNGVEDIRLDATYYDIIGTEFSYIPVEVKLYQETTLITSKQVVITITDTVFEDPVQISNIEVETGYLYPATHTFKEDADGANPAGFIVYEAGGTINVISELARHKKVVELYDDDDSDSQKYVDLANYFTAQTFGTIEFWFRATDVSTKLTNIMLRDGAIFSVLLYVDVDLIKIGGTTITSMVANKWYHMSLDFECGASGYKGLSPDTFYLTIDGVRYGAYNFNAVSDYINIIRFRSEGVTKDYYSYVDAIGFSWDTNYKTGDNIFWCNYPDISSGFESENVGTSGTLISYIDGIDGGGEITDIYPFFNEHQKVLRLKDDDIADYAAAKNNFASPQTSGVIEFWFYTTDTSKATNVYIRDSSTIAFRVLVNNGIWQYHDGAFQDTGVTASNNRWYHHKIVFDCTTDTFDWYIDNIKIVNDGGASNIVNSINNFVFATFLDDSEYVSYIDAVGYSWDANYCLGSNREVEVNNIWMSFVNDLNTYNNSHAIPFIVNNNPPVVKFYDSDGYFVDSIQLRPNCDKYGIEFYNTGTIEILDNHFIIPLPIPGTGEVCSIEKIWVNGTQYDFSYLVNSDGDLFIQLLTQDDVDGTYGSLYPIQIEYGISISFKTTKQFVASYDFALIPQDEYRLIGEFYDLSGVTSSYELNETIFVDFEGPYIFQQFGGISDGHYFGSDSFESYPNSYFGNYYGTESFEGITTEEGVYYGTHDFRDEIGEIGSQIDMFDTYSADSNCYAEVLSEFDDHKAVLMIKDENIGGSVIAYDNFDSNKLNPTIEFWIAKNSTSSATNININFLESSTSLGIFQANHDNLYWYNGTWTVIYDYLTVDTLYHVRLQFDDTNNEVDVWVNGILGLEDGQYSNPSTSGMTRLRINSGTSDTGKWYFDAFGYFWDTTSHSGLGYDVGMNINPYDVEDLLNENWNYPNLNSFDYSINVEDKSAHKNTLHMISNSSAGQYVDFMYTFDSSSSTGDIELWIYIPEHSGNGWDNGLYIWGLATYTISSNGYLYSYYDAASQQITDYSIYGAWHHIRIKYDGSNLYWYVDGNLEHTRVGHSTGSASNFRIRQWHSSAPGIEEIWIDAIGYSWDPNYDVGDNCNSYGRLQEMIDKGWEPIISPYTSIFIVDELDGHRKVLALSDNNPTLGSSIYTDYFADQTGIITIEFWHRATNSSSNNFWPQFWDDGTELIHLNWGNDYSWHIYDGGWTTYHVMDYEKNIWYHHRFELDMTAEIFKWWINGVLEESNGLFNNPVIDGLDRISFQTSSTGALNHASHFIDALAHGWDDSYEVGMNRYPQGFITPVNPDSDSISFIIEDMSDIVDYYFDVSIQGYWEVVGDIYTFYFNDTSIPEGLTHVQLTCEDSFGYTSTVDFILLLDRSAPNITLISKGFHDITSKLCNFEVFIDDITEYEISLKVIDSNSGTVYGNLEYTITEIQPNVWQVVFDTGQFSDGYYNVHITATDSVGNVAEEFIDNLLFDNTPPVIDTILEQIFVDSQNIYNNTIIDSLYFNDQEYSFLSVFDDTSDDYWYTISQVLGDQQGVQSVEMYYSNPLAWYNISIEGSLNYEQFIYKITGYGDPLETDLNKIKSIQKLEIGGYIIDKFNIILDGSSLLLSIDPQYRYLLSSVFTNQIYVQFYEAVVDSIDLSYNSNIQEWELLSSGRNYFNISDYLSLTEGDQFLFWFEIEDGIGNVLVSHKYNGWYDNNINKIDDYSLFDWHLGTNSTGSGIIIFGSDNYLDSTIQIDVSSILPDMSGSVDVDRIMIYGSPNETDWEFVGRAHYSGEEDLWYFYWDDKSLDPLPPENYFLKCYVFDKAGNYLNFMGHYSGTFSFTGEEVGTSGTDIDFVDGYSFSTCEIISSFEGHRNVLKLQSGSTWQSVWNTFSGQASGTIEFWIAFGEANIVHRMILYDSPTVATYIGWLDDGKLKYYDGTWNEITTYVANTWYHLRIDFECGAGGYAGLSGDTFYIWVDGTKYGPYDFYNGIDSIDKFYHDHKYANAETYYDANSFSWNGSYSIGENYHPFAYTSIKVYDYTTIKLLTDLVFGEILEFNATSSKNEQVIEGIIENYLAGSSTELWDVIAQYYNPLHKIWIPLSTDPATIQTNGSYSITWDINQDSSFMKSMYDFNYEYLPLQVIPSSGTELWGSWGQFSGNSEWKPLVISEVSSNLDISVYKFDNTSGWLIDGSLSSEVIISSIQGQVFTLFDIDGDNSHEIIRISTSQIDVIYLDESSDWVIKENVTALSGYEYFAFDVALYGDSTNIVVHQKDASEESTLWRYEFDSDYDLTKIKKVNCPINFEPYSIKILEKFSSNDRRAILVGGLISDSYYSQLIEYDMSLNIKNIVVDAILGKISVIEYGEMSGDDSIFLGIERLAIGRMDAVVALKRKSGTQDWIEFELSGFDDIRFEVLDLLTIQEDINRKLIISSKTGLFETKINYKRDLSTIISPICFITSVHLKQDLSPIYYPSITPEKNPIHDVQKVWYKLNGDGKLHELDPQKYKHSRTEIHLDLASVWSNLAYVKIAYSFLSFEHEVRTAVDPSFKKVSGNADTQELSASGMLFDDSSLPLLWLNPTTYIDTYPDWLSLPNGMTYQHSPVISGLGNTVLYPKIRTGWDGSLGDEYMLMPEMENSLINYGSSYDSGILSQYLNARDDYLAYDGFDGRFEGNYIDFAAISNPYVSDNYNFSQMYYSGIHNAGNASGLYNYYDYDGDSNDEQAVLVRNRLTDFETYGGNVAVVYDSGTLPLSLTDQWLTSVSYDYGWGNSSNLYKTQQDDQEYYQMNSDTHPRGGRFISAEFFTTPIFGGEDYYFSCHIETVGDFGEAGTLNVNGETIASGTDIDIDDLLIQDVNNMWFSAGEEISDQLKAYVYYFKLALVNEENPALQGISTKELETIFLNWSQYVSLYKNTDGIFGLEQTYKLPVIDRDGLDSIQVAFDGSIISSSFAKQYPLSVQLYNFEQSQWESIPISPLDGTFTYDIDELLYHDFWRWDPLFYAKKITINHNKVAVSFADFPVLIKYTDPELSSKAQEDGDDIYFTSSDMVTKLDHEIEKYSKATGTMVAWVRVPELSGSEDTVIYMFAGDPSSGSQQNPEDVWTPECKLVQHLNEGWGTRHDSTSYENDCTPYNG